jgi:hypothetical protein
MSANNSLSSRLEELRSRNPQSPQGESSYSGYNTPTRYSGSFMPSHSLSTTNEARANLQRRFTTDSNTFPTLSPIGSQPTQTMDSIDMSATVSLYQCIIRLKCLNTDLVTDYVQNPSSKHPPIQFTLTPLFNELSIRKLLLILD